MDAEKMDANLTYQFLDNLDDNHQVFVIENQETCEIVGTGTLLTEKKLIRNITEKISESIIGEIINKFNVI